MAEGEKRKVGPLQRTSDSGVGLVFTLCGVKEQKGRGRG